MTKRLIIILIPFIIIGCATSVLTMPNGDVYKFKGTRHEFMTFSDGDIKISINRKGKESFLKYLLGLMFVNMPDVSVNKD